MLDLIEKLLTVQDRDQRLRAFQLELNNLPAERAAKEKQIADSAARLEAAKTRAKEIEVEKRNLEVEAQAKRDSIAKYRNHQLATRKNEEYTALAHEIEAAEKVIRTIEDRELDLMAEAEDLKPAIASAEKTHSEEKAKIELVLSSLTDKKSSLEDRIAALRSERAASVEGIDEDVLDRYDRLFKTKNGSAVAPLEHEVCMGCHMKVTTQTVVAVKSETAVIHCPQCGRMLYIVA